MLCFSARVCAQEKDYPGKHKLVSEFSSGKKRGEVHAKLKEIAAEIEAAEGRKVELIKRRILENQNKGMFFFTEFGTEILGTANVYST